MVEAGRSGELQVRRRSSRIPVLWIVVAVVLVAVAWWYATHPEPLPVSDSAISTSTPVGSPVYVGVYAPGSDSTRTIHVRDIEVPADDGVPTVVTPKVCRGGSLGVTSEPDRFCTELVDAVGATVGPGDVLVLEIEADQPGETALGRVEVTYRDGLQWSTQPAGARVETTFLAR